MSKHFCRDCGVEAKKRWEPCHECGSFIFVVKADSIKAAVSEAETIYRELLSELTKLAQQLDYSETKVEGDLRTMWRLALYHRLRNSSARLETPTEHTHNEDKCDCIGLQHRESCPLWELPK